MPLLQKTIAELRELQHEEVDLVGGGVGGGPTSEPTFAPTFSYVTTPIGQVRAQDDGAGDYRQDSEW